MRTEDTAAEDTAAEDTAAEDTAAEDTAAEDTAAEDTAAEDTAAEDTAAEDPAAEDPAAEDPAAEQVAELRREAAGYRTRLRDTETQLRAALVELDGRLAANVELPANVELTREAVTAAVDELLAEQPHLRRRRASGAIGQGEGTGTAEVSLLGMLRG